MMKEYVHAYQTGTWRFSGPGRVIASHTPFSFELRASPPFSHCLLAFYRFLKVRSVGLLDAIDNNRRVNNCVFEIWWKQLGPSGSFSGVITHLSYGQLMFNPCFPVPKLVQSIFQHFSWLSLSSSSLRLLHKFTSFSFNRKKKNFLFLC
jgi:hypothetical protein